ncbi:MAG: radical SAM protein, partial [Gemmatimonadota bacterium]|nr:radical SAM protein [Gemmatimonadota bacterium]
EDIAFLKERWGSRHFYFPIEDLPPSMVRRLPEALLEANLDIDWWCDAKLEPEVFTPEVCAQLAEAGCRRLAFGYESASRRVLDLMCKGSDPELGMEVIRRVHDAGISVTLYVMVGFPTETEEEAQLTLNTLVENSRYFEEVSLRVFYLDYKSEVFRRPKDFDIAEVFPEESTDLQIYHDFRTGSGMDRARARRMYMEMLRRLKSHLPVFQNRNVLYHELKSHYFLYLVKAGSVDALMEGAFRERSAPGGLPDRPSAAAGLRVLPIRFDRDEVDTALEAATDGLTLPRYQFDLISGEVLETLDRTVSPIAPSKAVLVLDPRSGEVACLSPEGAELLASCRGDRTTQEVLQGLDPAIRADAGSFLKALAAEGLILEAARERSHA